MSSQTEVVPVTKKQNPRFPEGLMVPAAGFEPATP